MRALVLVFLLVGVGFLTYGSMPLIMFSGDKSLAEWEAPYPQDPSKKWKDVVQETCQQERGILHVSIYGQNTEHPRVSFTCTVTLPPINRRA